MAEFLPYPGTMSTPYRVIAWPSTSALKSTLSGYSCTAVPRPLAPPRTWRWPTETTCEAASARRSAGKRFEEEVVRLTQSRASTRLGRAEDEPRRRAVGRVALRLELDLGHGTLETLLLLGVGEKNGYPFIARHRVALASRVGTCSSRRLSVASRPTYYLVVQAVQSCTRPRTGYTELYTRGARAARHTDSSGPRALAERAAALL